MSPATGAIGNSPLYQFSNVYVYCGVLSFVGVSPSYEGKLPYGTFLSVSKTVPS